jgi:formamidopyrimidine-DNA glycosylase
MQALAERLDQALCGSILDRVDPIGFTGLKTVAPEPSTLVGLRLIDVTRRGKYLVERFEGGTRVLVHLSQAGRVDLESPAKQTRPRGSVFRMTFHNDHGLLVREHGSQRKAGWWVLGPDDDSPLAGLGPEPFDPAFEDVMLGSDSPRHVHSLLRDQRTVAGIGRGYADDVLNRAGVSPFAPLRALSPERRHALVESVRSVLDEALESERRRRGGLSEAKLGSRFSVHNRAGQACPRCGSALDRVSYDSYEISYCPACQTNGKVLADRRLSRLLR